MSDFGANIFDERPPHPGQPATAPPPAERAPQTDRGPAPAAPAPQPRPPVHPAPARRDGPHRDERPREPERHGRAERQDRHQGQQPGGRGASDGREPAPARERGPAVSHREAGPRPPAPPVRTHQANTVAVLVDLEGLQAEARAQGGELALHRLQKGLAGDRTVTRAACFAPRATTPPAGFDLIVNDLAVAAGIQFAATAMELAGRASLLVLAPPSAPIRQLASALRAQGHRIELAGFVATSDEGQTTRRLGRDCLFVP